MTGIELRSVAFGDHDLIPDRFTRPDANVSPPLEWRGVPETARELVLLCEDPDAPGGTFTHWMVTGIDPRSTGVAEGQVPPGGRQRRNSFGDTGWDGPQPPVGDAPHRYVFRLYAMPESLRLPRDADSETVHAAVDRGQLASGTLVGTFGR